MAESVREQLLGYLLGALEESEQCEVAERLARDPELRKELALVRLQLAPLDHTSGTYEAPFGLAARTCQLVFEAETPAEAAQPMPTPAAPMDPEVPATAAASSSWRLADLGVAAGILAAAVLLIFPALANSRFNAQVLECQNRLRQLGLALSQYSVDHGGYFPAIPLDGALAFAGSYAPTLRQAGYVQDDSLFFCPGSPAASEEQQRVPSLDELLASRSPRQLQQLRSHVGGDYGYSMGYWHDGCYCATRNLRRPYFVIMADMPAGGLPDLRSLNHGCRGQNVLFEDGHVKFLTTPCLAGSGDNFYLNDLGQVAAGQHRNDAVVGPSMAMPVRLAVPSPPLPCIPH
ncbi:MAG TPA: hypothetical protein EYP56_11425 [Planctomycetaceae bacterium]|nr:hypothetical protein [Planctomycetaceae bacterium]HIQ23185.1 hypothetical protein [Planctomycetota bacterium]